MSIESITAIDPNSVGAMGVDQVSSSGASFESWISDQLTTLNTSAQRVDEIVVSSTTDSLDNLHQMVYEIEKIAKSFELAVLVRDKALEAYQEVLRMQV